MKQIIVFCLFVMSCILTGHVREEVLHQCGSFAQIEMKIKQLLKKSPRVVLALDTAHTLMITLPSQPGITQIVSFTDIPHLDSIDWNTVEEKYHTALMNNWTIIIPGITGDLAKRKLIPALYTLFCQGVKNTIIGTTRRSIDKAEIITNVLPFIKNRNDDRWKEFIQLIEIKKLDTSDETSFKEFKKYLDAYTNPRLIYLSVPPNTFCDLTMSFGKAGIISKSNNSMVLYEKPFGTDEKSSQSINTCISHWLTNKQIYRVDHYAAKEFVRSIPSIAHDNPLLRGFQPQNINEIKIRFLEKLDVHTRGDYFDRYGILRDIVQNHVLQILAFATCSLNDRQERITFLQSLHVQEAEFGQYEGYTSEENINPESKTETYTKAVLRSNLSQWKDVSFIIEAGKALKEKISDLTITLKNKEGMPANTIRCEFVPEKFSITVNMRNAGLHAVTLDADNLPEYPDAYEAVFKDALTRQHRFSITMAEIEAQWHIVDQLQSLKKNVKKYPKGS